jgi:TldD protein
MTKITTDIIERIKPIVFDLATDAPRRLLHCRYADLRVEAVEGKGAVAENGASKSSSEDYGFSFGARVLAGERSVATGYFGQSLGAADLPQLAEILKNGLGRAYRRAMANAEWKADARGKFGPLGESLWDTRLHPVRVVQDVVPAVFEVDPRSVPLDAMSRFATDRSREVAAVHDDLKYNVIVAYTLLSRELFCSSEGASIDQAYALTQGMSYVVAVAGGVSQELYDVMGHQRGWEVLERGVAEPLIQFPPFREFCLEMAKEAVTLARAPALPTTDGEVVVVTDPHYNTLVSHEIIGHPAELDRVLKMETAYAGRSWLLRGLDEHQVGKQIASPLVTAYSDPSLPGYGHYTYDHEGTPAQKIVHIENGIFTGFMNSRQTAAIFGGDPNGHWKATDASLVPLIRMSTTVFGQGSRDPGEIIKEVERGYYLVGHRIPSIAESRENFRISARKVYEIRNGELGQLYRDGGIMADTKDYLMNMDAVGTDFRVYPIPNCGKGQPMQTKRLGNGGPTMRSRARLTGAVVGTVD